MENYEQRINNLELAIEKKCNEEEEIREIVKQEITKNITRKEKEK